ncbi:MAG TPA: acyl-CoA dehydrogenase family protein [Vicinamibacterales bacterium]
MLPDPYELVHDLEWRLGNPFRPDAPLSFSRSMELDEAETFPEESLACLNDWGLHRHAVPAALGGALVSFEHLLALTRSVSRRDLTAAIANGQTFLGCVPVWLEGTAEQRRRIADRVLARALAALALTERDHGSDLLATDTVATQTPAGYRLNGEKWLINNGTRAGVLTVLARTRSEHGPRSCSVLLVDKARLPGNGWLHLDKVHTLGIRGADISGIRFDGCDIAFDDLVGVPGHGLDLVLKSLQVTRTLCAAFSLGAADTALRTTLRFALSRMLYGGAVLEIPHARRTLVGAFVDVLVCDCVATAAARALHVLTQEMSVWSPIVKYFVPVTVESSLRDLAAILGARH